MDFILKSLSSRVLGPVFALLAGILASASPCAMAAIPVVVGHMMGTDTRKKSKQLFLFVLGMATALTAAGMVVGLLGKSLLFAAPWVRPLAGMAFIVAGLLYSGFVWSSKTCQAVVSFDEPEKKTSLLRDTFKPVGLGMLYGVSASPCATPALLAILTVIASSGSPVTGGILLLAYSFGQSVLVVFAGYSASKLRQVLENEKNLQALDVIRKVGGVAIALFGLYLLVRPYL